MLMTVRTLQVARIAVPDVAMRQECDSVPAGWTMKIRESPALSCLVGNGAIALVGRTVEMG